ncbi:hypothetical protein H2Y56_22120 [Pectobacterium aroidearum]|uniref:DUF550 domain-containing protein n=1 Tax=Pectobacterium aroidearum TaxID=1201031 RepID=A0ABR5ZJX6_9GAMM|nr:hypothetical protein [Pectobacterium aroidearum]MBA5234781.1 hypothetical protein [Pectobacterium aroidearum]MBA5739960.1 hypothetical protein [Pectobacterium aroidearum]
MTENQHPNGMMQLSHELTAAKRHIASQETIMLTQGQLIAELKNQLETERSRVVAMPDLNADLIEILGRPNFMCSPVAHCLRIGGVGIPRKSENEQAACIHWMLGLYLEHRENWKAVGKSELQRIASLQGKEE